MKEGRKKRRGAEGKTWGRTKRASKVNSREEV